MSWCSFASKFPVLLPTCNFPVWFCLFLPAQSSDVYAKYRCQFAEFKLGPLLFCIHPSTPVASDCLLSHWSSRLCFKSDLTQCLNFFLSLDVSKDTNPPIARDWDFSLTLVVIEDEVGLNCSSHWVRQWSIFRLVSSLASCAGKKAVLLD